MFNYFIGRSDSTTGSCQFRNSWFTEYITILHHKNDTFYKNTFFVRTLFCKKTVFVRTLFFIRTHFFL